jgi:outer membrane protein TolC
MRPRYLLSVSSQILGFAAFWLHSQVAFATQPLETFLAGARSSSFDAREQAATVEQRNWEHEAALGRLLPSLTARGVYTRNQYESVIPAGPITPVDLTITPQNQFDATFQLDVPIVDLANYHRYKQAGHLAKAAQAQSTLSSTDVDRAVARSYYTFVGASALVGAADRSVKIAEENLSYVNTRFSAGVATELDRERARANLERAKQDRTDAELVRTIAARNLETVTGISPTPVTEYSVDDLHAEAPLNDWMANRDTPADRVQVELGHAASSAKKAAASALLPTLSASAQERISNATGFSGRTSAYTLQAVLAWRLDYGTYATAQAQASAADVQKVRAERSRRTTEDSIFEAHQRVGASISKSASARAQSDAANKAEQLARSRYLAGALTQLDVTQSQRDAFQAQAARIQADADLAYARVLLRVVAGKPPVVPASTLPALSAEELAAGTANAATPPAPAPAPSSTPAPIAPAPAP